MLISGHSQKVLLCTKCRRLFKDAGLIKTWSKETKDIKSLKHENIKAKEKIIKEAVVKEEPKKVEKKIEEKKTKKIKKTSVPTMSIEDLVGKKK